MSLNASSFAPYVSPVAAAQWVLTYLVLTRPLLRTILAIRLNSLPHLALRVHGFPLSHP